MIVNILLWIFIYFFAIIGWVILGLFAYPYGVFNTLRNGVCSQWHKDMAIAFDQYLNVFFAPIFNDTMIKDEGYKFGNGKETMSSVYGKNKKLNKLRKAGYSVTQALHIIDHNHVEKSIDETQNNKEDY